MDYITIEVNQDKGRVINVGDLYETLKQVKDKRQEKGQRYTIEILLMVVILAKLCGENTPHGMAEWATMRAEELPTLFAYHRRVRPSNKTLQR